jgi:hypothetical protein
MGQNLDAAFRHKKTGQVVVCGACHDIQGLPNIDSVDDPLQEWECGYVDPQTGQFVPRKPNPL